LCFHKLRDTIRFCFLRETAVTTKVFGCAWRAAWGVLLSFVAVTSFAANTNVNWDFDVSPSAVNLNVGDTVTFIGNMSFHPVSAANASFVAAGGTISNGGNSFVRAFPTAGTFYFVCVNHGIMQFTVNVTNANTCNPPANPAVLDIDGNGQVDAATDGLLVVRYLIGLRGDGLINGAMGNCPGRATAMSIETYLAARVVP
jgi:plastocyanin